MRDITIDLQNFDKWKTQFTIAISFTSSEDIAEECAMRTKGCNKEFMTYNNANDIVDELFETLLSRYQNN